jgi:hypothetical protein
MSTNRFPTVINSKGIKASKVPILDLNMENYYKIDVQMIIKGTKGGFKGSIISSKKEQKQKKNRYLNKQIFKLFTPRRFKHKHTHCALFQAPSPPI